MKQILTKPFYLLLALSIATLLNLASSYKIFAATASGTIYQYVTASATVEKISDFKFTKQGRSTNSNNAHFSLSGLSNNTFTVSLLKKEVFLKHQRTGETIEIKGFETYPDGTSKIKPNGKRKLLINIAQVPALKNTNNKRYYGNLVVDVVY